MAASFQSVSDRRMNVTTLPSSLLGLFQLVASGRKVAGEVVQFLAATDSIAVAAVSYSQAARWVTRKSKPRSTLHFPR